MADRVAIGRIRGAHGIRGEVKVETFDPRSGSLRTGKKVWLGDETEPRTITGARPHGPGMLVTFEGVTTRTEAEALLNRELLMERVALPKLKKDEYYLADIEGFTVETKEGEIVGTIEGNVAGSPQEILIVRGAEGGSRAGKEMLIPAVEGILLSVDLAAKRVVVDPPEGLLDL